MSLIRFAATMISQPAFANQSNVSVSASAGGTCEAGVRFNTDGSTDENDNTTYTQITTGQWYTKEPVTGIGSSYEVRCSAVNSGAWDVAAAATGTWVAMSASREWRVSQVGTGDSSVDADFEIRVAGGSTQTTFNVFASALVI